MIRDTTTAKPGECIFWDHKEGRVHPRPMTREWHRAWQMNETAGRNKKTKSPANHRHERFELLGVSTPDALRELKGKDEISYMDAKNLVTGVIHSLRQAVAGSPALPEPEPFFSEEPAGRKIPTRGEINKMTVGDLVAWCENEGVDVGEGARAADLRVKLIANFKLS